MDAATLSILILALLFLGAFIPRFSLAVAALPAAALVAVVAGVSIDQLLEFFPADFFVLIVGITAFFAVAKTSGATDWLLAAALRPIGDRTILVPLLLFAVGALITAIGTFPAAGIAIMAPITLGVAAQRGLPPILLCLTMLNGITCGLFSPIAVFGSAVPRMLTKAGIDMPSETGPALFLASLGTGLVLCLIVMAAGRRSLRAAATSAGSAGQSAPNPIPASGDEVLPGHTVTSPEGGTPTAVLSRPLAATQPAARAPKPSSLTLGSVAIALIVLVIGGAVFQLNLGLLGLALALALQLLLRIQPSVIIGHLPWEIVLLIAGLLTYIGLMQHLGAFQRITRVLTIAGSPTLSLLAVCLIVGVTSFFASSLAVIATGVPLIAPLVAAGVSPVNAIIAVGLSAVLVDVNPLGITGGLLLGAAAPEQRQRLFRHLLIYGMCSIVLGPLLAWAAFGTW
ncbi:SLC13 family permease [Amycolatopsis endophytica]|uniref:Di/tricarboxylate transporter n=1 Tax=Amycolatopsis endophytica TaxID=860233 RepID=A0A853BBU5_9PSEU|nr:SLC13 family permease [Amycolatopsis endophytica]NYI92232.1 di/tricarboxylate transporter [Amycolatopsis endophytica]